MRKMDKESLASHLARLETMDRKDLVVDWKKTWGTDPPASVSKQLLRLAHAYRLQEQVLGGLKPYVKSRLQLIAMRKTDNFEAVPIVKPGTRLIREWHGGIHEVLVMDEGVIYRGQRYKSLTAVTQAITGSKQSGPLFFGLYRRR